MDPSGIDTMTNWGDIDQAGDRQDGRVKYSTPPGTGTDGVGLDTMPTHGPGLDELRDETSTR